MSSSLNEEETDYDDEERLLAYAVALSSQCRVCSCIIGWMSPLDELPADEEETPEDDEDDDNGTGRQEER